MLCSQQAGQGTSERMHQVTKQVRMKTSNKQSGVVGAAYTKIKMGILQQRATDVNTKKIIQRTYKVSLLGLVCEKMALHVSEIEKTETERVVASTLVQIQAVPAQSFVDFEAEDDDVDIENEMLGTSIAYGRGGSGGGGCCFSPVIVGWVGERGGGGYGIGVALDLDIYIYI